MVFHGFHVVVQVCKMVHDAVKSALGKPDQYITVALMKAECVTVAGKEASVVPRTCIPLSILSAFILCLL